MRNTKKDNAFIFTVHVYLDITLIHIGVTSELRVCSTLY